MGEWQGLVRHRLDLADQMQGFQAVMALTRTGGSSEASGFLHQFLLPLHCKHGVIHKRIFCLHCYCTWKLAINMSYFTSKFIGTLNQIVSSKGPVAVNSKVVQST